jgi:formate dehydrogenase subunit gamma
MAAPTTPSAEPTGALELVRFDRTERNVHWWTAALVGTCLATAAALSMTVLAGVVGRRAMVREVHVLAGLSLPVPMLVGWLLGRRFGSELPADVRRLNRYDVHDRRWLRSLGRDPFVRNGKFNGGQKLNAAFVAGALLVLMATGSIMKWFGPFPLAWRTGATFVHDWTAWLLTIALIGHVAKAFGDRHALRAMQHGTVPRRWAERHAPRWLEELDG